jgi:hypothetical protein
MNPKLRLILLSRLNNRGFALPFTLTVGLVMMLAGIMMIVRSQSNQTNVKAQQATSQGISAAQVGATRIQKLMNENRYIAMYPDCIGRDSAGACTDSGTTTQSWANVSNIPKLTVCDATDAAGVKDVSLKQQWQPIEPDNPSQGEYRLISYQYSKPGEAPGLGTLKVEGRVGSKNEMAGAATQVQVEIPVSPGTPDNTSIPGVWLTTGGTGKNGIQGDVLLGDCNAQPSTINVTGTNPTTGKPYTVKYTNLQFPDLPKIPNTAIVLGVLGDDKNSTTASLSGDITLPRSTDTAVTKTINGQSVQVYEYVVDQINFDSGSHSLTITPGKKVNLYLNGSMIVKSNSNIVHSCTDGSGNAIAGCQPTDFKIYGYGDETNSICTAGNKRIEAFIFAPKYTVGTAGTGGGAGGIKGSIWAYEWSNGKSCGSETQNTAVVQTGTWDDLGLQPKNTPPQLSNISAWQRNER